MVKQMCVSTYFIKLLIFLIDEISSRKSADSSKKKCVLLSFSVHSIYAVNYLKYQSII